MTGLFPRLLLAALACCAGAVVGAMVAGDHGLLVGALVAGFAALLAVTVVDAARGWRLMRWLREEQPGSAPRDSGFWGELAYRFERSLRGLERQAEVERTHLTQFVSAMEASPNGVLLLDATDQIEWCNARAAEHFGLDPERDRRQRVTNLIRSPAFVEYLQAGSFDEPMLLRDPRQGSLQVTIRPYGSGSKLVISQDLTERERADAMRRDFVANVSHEIRTPLTVLSGFLETLRNLPLTEVERKRVLMLMTQQAERMGNLVNNAVRYTADGGRVDVAWRRLDNGTGEVAVTDSGTGIAREHLSRLTERFYRVDGSRSRESGGTGLGLAIVKHVVQRHGGELDIASEPGKGSTFRLLFPATRVRVDPAPAATAPEAVAEPASR